MGLLNVIKALGPRYTVDVLSLRGEDLPLVERVGRARMLRVPVPGSGSGEGLAQQLSAFGRAIGRQLEGSEYDAVHLRSALGARALLAAVGTGAEKIVYEVARSTEGEPRAADAEASAELALEERACLERADLVLVPAAYAESHVRQTHPRSTVVIVPPGVDIDHFDWLVAEPEEAPAHIVYAGRIGAGRGVRLLLKALGIVKKTHAVRLVLAGACDESFTAPLDEARIAAGLDTADVELLGAVDHDDMPRVLSRANCVSPPPAPRRPIARWPAFRPRFWSIWRAGAPWWRRVGRRCRRSSPTGATAFCSRPATLTIWRRASSGSSTTCSCGARWPTRAIGACARNIRPRPRGAACSKPTRACSPPTTATAPRPAPRSCRRPPTRRRAVATITSPASFLATRLATRLATPPRRSTAHGAAASWP